MRVSSRLVGYSEIGVFTLFRVRVVCQTSANPQIRRGTSLTCGRLVVKDLLLRHNRLSREWLTAPPRSPVSRIAPRITGCRSVSMPADAGQCFVLIGPFRNCVTAEASREDEKIV